MSNLTRAHRELYRRPADERFESLTDLHAYCQSIKDRCSRYKYPATEFRPKLSESDVAVEINGHGAFRLNSWSFGQLCSLAGAAKETVNRLQPATASQVLSETLTQRVDDDLDLQALVMDDNVVRAITGEKYKRLWSADLLSMVREFATDFTPPQQGAGGATGLYAGEQDMFCFLIDPAGWTEIGGEAFAPGFYLWNSEVGKRTVGVSTFWFQAVCQYQIVWDAVEVVEFTRRHTGRPREALAAVRDAIEQLVAIRDQRRDGFARVVAKAMGTKYGRDGDEVQKLLAKAGFTKQLAKKATEIAVQNGAFTIWSVVDALTQLARSAKFACSRPASLSAGVT
jgi:hypothetical protein